MTFTYAREKKTFFLCGELEQQASFKIFWLFNNKSKIILFS